MAALNPYVLADAGFQLSFLAMLGITLLSPGIFRALKRPFVPGWVVPVIAVVAAGVGAQVATVPLVALLTGRVSLVSLPASMLVEPALLPLMVAGILTGVVGAVAPPLAILFSPFAWFAAAWMLLWVGWFASVPLAFVQLESVNPLWAFAYYGAVVYVLWMVGYSRRVGVRGET
jgi:competence protein ComEC